MPWWIYLEFFVLYVGFLGVLTPRLFFKKDAYYLAHIVGELIAFIVFFINMPVSLVIAFLSMFLPTIIIEHFKDNTGHNSYKSSGYGTSKKKDYQKLYPEVFNAVGSSVSKIDTEFGFVRFRMNTVSMFHNEKESLVCTLNKPLSSESELRELTNAVCEKWAFVIHYSDTPDYEFHIANQIWRDEQGPYRLLVVYGCDHHGVPFKPWPDFYLHYTEDLREYSDRSLRQL